VALTDYCIVLDISFPIDLQLQRIRRSLLTISPKQIKLETYTFLLAHVERELRNVDLRKGSSIAIVIKRPGNPPASSSVRWRASRFHQDLGID
jgi:hypothetical protein